MQNNDSRYRRILGGTVSNSLWCVYLGLIVTGSFIQDFYDSTAWMLFSTVFYAVCVLQLIQVLLHQKVNHRAVLAAKPVIILLLFSYGWLWCQTWLPYQTSVHQYLIDATEVANLDVSWFAPHTVWSVVPQKTHMLLMSELLMGGFFLLTLSLVTTRRRLSQLLITFAIVALAHATIGIGAKYTGLTLVEMAQIDGHFTAARAWFVNRNHFASFVSLSLCGALALQLSVWIRSRDTSITLILLRQLTSAQWLSLMVLLIGLIGLLLSQSRAGFFGFCLSFILVVWASGQFKVDLWRRKSFIALVVSVFGLLIFYFGGELASRLNASLFSVGERSQQWATTIDAIKHEWLLGYGGNSYATVFQIFREDHQFRQVIYNQAHNDFLHIWLEQGLVGLGLWLAIVAIVLRRAFHLIRLATNPIIVSTVFACAVVLIAAQMQSFVDFNLQILPIRLYFFVIMALVFCAPSIKYRAARRKRAKIKPLTTLSPDRL